MTKNEQMNYVENIQTILELNLYKFNLAISDCSNNGISEGYRLTIDEIYDSLSVIPARLELFVKTTQADMRAERKSEVTSNES